MATEKRLIDANALKDRFKLRLDWLKLDVHDEYTKGLYHGCDYDMTLIDEQHTVDAVEVVHGRWDKYIDDDGDKASRCTACGWNITYEDCTLEELGYNYCPNCGAKMDGDGNV